MATKRREEAQRMIGGRRGSSFHTQSFLFVPFRAFWWLSCMVSSRLEFRMSRLLPSLLMLSFAFPVFADEPKTRTVEELAEVIKPSLCTITTRGRDVKSE